MLTRGSVPDVWAALAFLRENIHFVLELGMLLLLAYTMRSKPKRASESAVQLTKEVRAMISLLLSRASTVFLVFFLALQEQQEIIDGTVQIHRI